MKTKEQRQQNKYGANQMIKIVAIIILVYLLLHIRPLKDPYGNRFIAFNMDNFCGFFSSSGEGFVMFPHTMETELGSINMKPFCWIRYSKGFLLTIRDDKIKSQVFFNNQELKGIERISFYTIHVPEYSDRRKSYIDSSVDGFYDLCISFTRLGYPIKIGTNTVNLSQIWNTSYKESKEFNNLLLTILCEDNSEYKGVLEFKNNVRINYKEFAKLFIPRTNEFWRLSHTNGIFLIEGLTKEPLECTEIYFEPDWGGIKKVVTPEGKELVF